MLQETGNMVFNVITDQQNFYAMKIWFSRNSYKEAVVHVMNVEDLNLNNAYGTGLLQLSPSVEFRASVRANEQPFPTQTRTEYMSLFGHSHFLLPEIFKNLKLSLIHI